MATAASPGVHTEFYRCDDPSSYANVGVPKAHISRLIMPYRQFQCVVARSPRSEALIAADRTLTFAQLGELVDAYASGLVAMGLQRGEGVAAVVGNRWEQLPLFLAVAKIGGVFMAASRYLTRHELEYQIGAFRPRFIVGENGYSLGDIEAAATGEAIAPFDDEHAGFSLRFSSGTTGKPKMMIASHRQQAALYPLVSSEMGLQASDRQLVVGPLAHMALHMALAQLFVGGAIVLKEAFEKERLWQDCEVHGITNVAVVPTMISAALEYRGEAPQLRAMLSMGAPLAAPLKHRLLNRFPGLGLFEMYGASELGMATCLRPEHQLRKPTSVGQPCVGQDVAIFDDAGEPCAPGTIGTVYVRGQLGIMDYLGDVRPAPPPQHLAAQGWSHCGDLGSIDDEGFLYISDRRADLILSGGLNVYPAEIEAVLCQIEGIGNVAVIGTPDERWGKRVTAYVEGDVDEVAITALCREMLAAYKLPRAIFKVDQLPKTSTGKISRALVRDAVERGDLPS
jgi:acyl-CoA synthetase (AMP-forming)/AMP-acid ligase II